MPSLPCAEVCLAVVAPSRATGELARRSGLTTMRAGNRPHRRRGWSPQPRRYRCRCSAKTTTLLGRAWSGPQLVGDRHPLVREIKLADRPPPRQSTSEVVGKHISAVPSPPLHRTDVPVGAVTIHRRRRWPELVGTGDGAHDELPNRRVRRHHEVTHYDIVAKRKELGRVEGGGRDVSRCTEVGCDFVGGPSGQIAGEVWPPQSHQVVVDEGLGEAALRSGADDPRRRLGRQFRHLPTLPERRGPSGRCG